MESYIGLYIPIKKCATETIPGQCICVCAVPGSRYISLFLYCNSSINMVKCIRLI